MIDKLITFVQGCFTCPPSKEIEDSIELEEPLSEEDKKNLFTLVWRRIDFKKHTLYVECKMGDSMQVCSLIKDRDEIDFIMGISIDFFREEIINLVEDIKDIKVMKDNILSYLKPKLIWTGDDRELKKDAMYLWCSSVSENGGYFMRTLEAA